MDQFTYAERATDWRGNNNIAESMFTQMARERHPVPRWIVVGAGTGGTSATMGRYVRYQRHATQVCVPDPVGSVFGQYHRTRRPHADRRRARASKALAGRVWSPASSARWWTA
jgi:cysteine synthase A